MRQLTRSASMQASGRRDSCSSGSPLPTTGLLEIGLPLPVAWHAPGNYMPPPEAAHVEEATSTSS
jgi:hypothetical protein